MPYKELYIFVEGPDDVRFFESPKIKNFFLQFFTTVKLIPYARMTPQKKEDYIKSINSISYARYLFVKDLDKNICITNKKDEIKADCNILELSKILIVDWEIESRYAAGLDDDDCTKLEIKKYSNTNGPTKENFDALANNPKKYDRYLFMIECKNKFKIQVARVKNNSFNYLLKPSTIRKLI